LNFFRVPINADGWKGVDIIIIIVITIYLLLLFSF